MMDNQRGLYIISVAARLLDMHPQTLRKYERAGFLTPNRTGGMLRLYSAEDIERLQLIKHLVEDLGLNLAGVELGLALHQVLGKLQHEAGAVNDLGNLRQLVSERLGQALDLLGARRTSPAPGDRVGETRRTTVRITRYRLHHRDHSPLPQGEGQGEGTIGDV